MTGQEPEAICRSSGHERANTLSDQAADLQQLLPATVLSRGGNRRLPDFDIAMCKSRNSVDGILYNYASEVKHIIFRKKSLPLAWQAHQEECGRQERGQKAFT